MIRILTTYFLLLLFIVLNVVSHLVYHFEIAECHDKERTENLHGEIMTAVFANDEEINWLRYGKEFEIDGRLCDVIEITKGEATTIRYVEDFLEQKIVSCYGKIIRDMHNSARNISRSGDSFKFIFPLNHISTAPENPIGEFFISVVYSLTENTIQIFSPPPNC